MHEFLLLALPTDSRQGLMRLLASNLLLATTTLLDPHHTTTI
jgi:hypothetical protein